MALRAGNAADGAVYLKIGDVSTKSYLLKTAKELTALKGKIEFLQQRRFSTLNNRLFIMILRN